MSKRTIGDAIVAAAYVWQYMDHWNRISDFPSSIHCLGMAEEAIAIAGTFEDATIDVEWTCTHCGYKHEWVYPKDTSLTQYVCEECGKRTPVNEL